MLFEKLKKQKLKKIVQKFDLKMLKVHQKKNIKNRRFTANKTDSWRKKIHFYNPTSTSYFFLKFNTLFNMFVLKNINKTTSGMYLQNDVLISNFNIESCLYFIILCFKNFYFYFPINFIKNSLEHNIYMSKTSSSIEINNSVLFWLNFSLISLIKSWFNNILKVSYNYIFLKLKYKGKNYRWHRKKKGLVLRFGHSHLIYSKKPNSVFLKKKGRMKILFFGTNVELIYFFLRNLIKWKPSNVYTGRGLRLSRQRLLKKSGKISAYR